MMIGTLIPTPPRRNAEALSLWTLARCDLGQVRHRDKNKFAFIISAASYICGNYEMIVILGQSAQALEANPFGNGFLALGRHRRDKSNIDVLGFVT